MENRKSDSQRLGERILLPSILLLASLVLYGQEKTGPATPPPASGARIVPLKQIPVWELANEHVRSSFLSGQSAMVRVLEKGMVIPLKWPQFTSDAPLYGEITFQNLAAGPRKSDHFFFAVDSSRKGGDYDLLYFDDNGDEDLTNDKVRKPSQESERLAWHSPSIKETWFEPLEMTFDFGTGGPQTLELLPGLRIYEGSQRQFRFSFPAARVHSGRFEIGGTSYDACVGHQYMIRGRFDEPSTTLILTPEGGQPAFWWGGDELCAVHYLDGRYWRFSCTPVGDRLSVRPYDDGPVGVFEIGAGERKIENEKLSVRGSLRSKEMAVPVGAGLELGWPQPARRCEIPVGDYYPTYMTVALGDLSISVSNNYHTNAQGWPRSREPVAGIAIRADKPYVLDFSNKPAVIFTEPVGAPEREFARGETITIKAVLVDPVLDIMIRRLNVTAGTPTGTPDGMRQSLDPKVTIARANGEIVAEGIMPFG